MGTAPLARHPLALGEEERKRKTGRPRRPKMKPGANSARLLGCLTSEDAMTLQRVTRIHPIPYPNPHARKHTANRTTRTPMASETPVTIPALQQMKRDGKKSVGVVAWDYQIALIAERAGVDFVSVGDSVGINLWGHSN